MKLNSFTLQVFKPKQTLDFYTKILGLHLLNEFSEDDSIYYNLGFTNKDFYIQLRFTPSLSKVSYQLDAADNYWKYSLFVDDIQKQHQEIGNKNHKIGAPFQFGNIGYLAHTADIENHQIEYIQKTFKQNTPKQIEDNKTTLGLLTIRTKDPLKSIRFYEDILDLKLFVRMYVDRGNGFTLYFLGHKDLKAPSSNIDATENREWMYQQSHLFIEIQHYWNSEYDTDFSLKSTRNNGLKSINFSGNLDVLKERLTKNNILFHQEEDRIRFETIDRHVVMLKTTYNNVYNS